MASDDLGLAQPPAQAAEGDGLAERLRLEAEADVMETARDGTFERRDAERWAAIMYEAADEIDRLRALSADAAATIAAARLAAEEMREPTDEMVRAMLAEQWPATYREHLHHPMDGPNARRDTEQRADLARRMFSAAIRALPLPPSSSPEDQQKAAATPTIADPDGEANHG